MHVTVNRVAHQLVTAFSCSFLAHYYCMCSLTFHKHVTALSLIHSQSYHHVRLLRTSCQHYQLHWLKIHMPPLYFHSQVSHIQSYTFQGRLSSLLCAVKTLMHLKLPFHKLSYIPEVNSVSFCKLCHPCVVYLLRRSPLFAGSFAGLFHYHFISVCCVLKQVVAFSTKVVAT